MQVILLERIGRLGHMGETVNVKPGYARNYLLPQKKALRATPSNIAFFEAQKAKLEADNAARRAEAETLAKKVDGLKVVIIRQAGETGHLFGSVSARDIADVISAQGYKVSRDMVAMHHPIKTIGLFEETVHLHPEVEVTVKLNVARTEDEAKLQEQKGGALIAVTAQAESEGAKAAAEAPAHIPGTEEQPEVSFAEAKKAVKKKKKAAASEEEPAAE